METVRTHPEWAPTREVRRSPVNVNNVWSVTKPTGERASDVTNGVATNGNGVSESNARQIKKLKTTQGNVATNGASNGASNGTSSDEYEFLRQVVDIIIEEGLIGARDRNNKVCEFLQPEDLRAKLDFMKIGADPASPESLLEASKAIIKHSVKTTHPRFFNQLFGGMKIPALAGTWLTDSLNTSQYTYEVAPVFTMMEHELFNKILSYIGFDGGDAIFVPGGSIGNIYALNLARYIKFPLVKKAGMYCIQTPLSVFTSDKSHYSMKKGMALLGLGSKCLWPVKTDKDGRMLVSDLEQQIQISIKDGFQPFFVNATAGTTVMGAYDPLDEIADVCKKYDLWLHVDGAWGGSVAISNKYKHYIKGIERADSMVWNPHKMMGALLQCSMFLTKHKEMLKECHEANAKYLFQQDKHYDVGYDTGDMSIQCGRKVDVLKLWMLWKAKGDQGMEEDVDHLFMLSRYLVDKMKKTPGFRLLCEPQCTNVCFWYIPPSLRGKEETEVWWDKLALVAPKIKERMMMHGCMMIGYQPCGKHVNFWRMVLANSSTTTQDMDFLVEEFERIGLDL